MGETLLKSQIENEVLPVIIEKNHGKDEAVAVVKEAVDCFFKLKESVQSDLRRKKGQNGDEELNRLYALNSAIEQITDNEKVVVEVTKEIQNRISNIDGNNILSLFVETISVLDNQLFQEFNKVACQNVTPTINVRTSKPQYFTIPNTKITNVIFNPIENQEFCYARRVPILKDDKVFLKKVQCTQLIDGKDLPSCLNQYDKNVFSGVCSIFENYNANSQPRYIMTAAMIFEAFTGKDKPSKQALAKVVRSLEKMASTRISFDWTEHAILNKLTDEEMAKNKKTFLIERDNILHLHECIFSINGAECHAYELLKVPSLYDYSKRVNQVVSVKKEVISIPTVANTEDSVVIKNYIVYRIELMKNPRNKISNRNIRFNTIYDECGINVNSAVERKRKKDLIVNMLEYWKSINYIVDYYLEKQGNTYQRIKIILNEDKGKYNYRKHKSNITNIEDT